MWYKYRFYVEFKSPFPNFRNKSLVRRCVLLVRPVSSRPLSHHSLDLNCFHPCEFVIGYRSQIAHRLQTPQHAQDLFSLYRYIWIICVNTRRCIVEAALPVATSERIILLWSHTTHASHLIRFHLDLHLSANEASTTWLRQFQSIWTMIPYNESWDGAKFIPSSSIDCQSLASRLHRSASNAKQILLGIDIFSAAPDICIGTDVLFWATFHAPRVHYSAKNIIESQLIQSRRQWLSNNISHTTQVDAILACELLRQITHPLTPKLAFLAYAVVIFPAKVINY